MPELSNLLRQRLAATETGETQAHPDADTLTAHMEHALPLAESKIVVAHLSVCEPCREVMSLSQALMAQPDTQTVLTQRPVPRWRRLFTPVFGAAAAVAAMAVIAVMVLQLPQKNPQQGSNSATNRTASPAAQESQAKATVGDQAAPAESKESAPPTQQADGRLTSATSGLTTTARETEARLEDSGRAKAKKLASSAPMAAQAMQPANAPVLTAALPKAALPKKDYVNTNFFVSNGPDKVVLDSQGNNLPAAPQPQPGATNNAFNTGNNKIAMFADLPANAAGKSTVRLLTPSSPPEHPGCTVCKIVQSTAHTLGFHSPVKTPALRANGLTSSALGGPGMFSGAIEKNQPSELSAAPAKAETDTLAASSSLSAGAMAYRSADSVAPNWKIVSGKLMKSSSQAQWEDAYPIASSAMEFSFVNARGNDVWAGGSHASLIHSRDGGQTWETIKLGDNAIGTIVSIIAGTMSVQVKTSDNQSWSSADGGKSWILRE
jgi:hypothetical protein